MEKSRGRRMEVVIIKFGGGEEKWGGEVQNQNEFEGPKMSNETLP
jgi:hypothetical protein